jgi:DNA invertase Pin-like site-specific DNA recombinase
LPELNTLTLGIFGSVAQWERELISSRTKRGLEELKKRGVKLGTPQNFTKEGRI